MRKTRKTTAVKRAQPETFEPTQFIHEFETFVHLNHLCAGQILGHQLAFPTNRPKSEARLARTDRLIKLCVKPETASDLVSGIQSEFFGTQSEKASLILGIALGKRFIDSKGISHGDLKPSNIFVKPWRKL
jgi:serine/threonine protein kinase